MIHLTHHSLHRLTDRTYLTPDHTLWALTEGLPLASMPESLRTYLMNKPNYNPTDLYRLYLGLVLVYRPNTFKGTRFTKPYALITVLIPPKYTLETT